MKRNQVGRQGGKQQPRAGSGSQEQPRMEIIKGDKLGRQGGKQQPRAGSGSQEQPRMEIIKRDKLGRQGGKQQPRAGSGSQEHPRMETIRGDKAWDARRQRPARFSPRSTCSLAFAHPLWHQVVIMKECDPTELKLQSACPHAQVGGHFWDLDGEAARHSMPWFAPSQRSCVQRVPVILKEIL